MGVEEHLSAERLAGEIAPWLRKQLGSIRRMAISATNQARWVLLGHEKVSEKPTVEVFHGIGRAARPPKGANAEAVVVHPGGAAHPLAAALRDQETWRALDIDIADDETIQFNSVTVVYHRKTGVVEIRTPTGTAAPCARTSELAWLKSAITSIPPPADPDAAALLAAIQTVFDEWSIPGTTVLRAE